MITSEGLDTRFDYHKPDELKAARHETVRDACKETAKVFLDTIPDGREAALAYTKLEEAMFWANAAIAREG